jgi:DNA-binding NarL/FixJ family response regulator
MLVFMPPINQAQAVASSPERSTNRIRLIVADDHMVMRMGVVSAVSEQPDMQVVAEVESGELAIEAYREHRPDVVVLDLRMGKISGMDTIRALRAEFPNAKIVVFSNYARVEDVTQALKAGASGFVGKSMKAAKLLEAIRMVDGGKRYVPADVAPRASDRLRSNLSDRETDVLRHIAKGHSNKEIASLLGLTEGTVKVHVTNILAKLDVAARTEALVVAVRRGLIDID